MKELELKYGCNPNQKPAKIFTNDGRDPADSRFERQTGLYQSFGCVQLLAACKRAESGNRHAGGGFL